LPRGDEQRARAALDSVGVFNLLTDERFFDTLEAHLPPYRERLYTPTQTLAMFVCQVLSDDRSCRRVVDEHIARCALHGQRVPSSSTGAYCDARQRLPQPLVSVLCDEVARVARTIATGEPCVPAPATLLIDGTGFSMPDTPENQQAFPQSASQREGCGFPQGRLVGLVCATTGVVVDRHVTPAKGKGTGESTALRAMIERIEPGTLVIGDAIYEDFFAWALLEQAHCAAIFEVHGSRGLPHPLPRRLTFKRPCRPVWMSPEQYATIPRTRTLRVVVSTRPGCEDRYLITSLLDEQRHPDEAVLAEFARRWDIELDFRSFKDGLGAGVLGCRTPEMVAKELDVHVLGYNLIRLLMSEAAAAAGLEPRQISFRHTQQCWSAWVLMGVPLNQANWQVLLDRIAQHRVRNRPGRKEPRAVKRRPKRTVWLNLPRAQAREVRHLYERTGR